MCLLLQKALFLLQSSGMWASIPLHNGIVHTMNQAEPGFASQHLCLGRDVVNHSLPNFRSASSLKFRHL